MSAVWDAIEHPAQPPAAGGLSHTLELCSCINSLIHSTRSKPLRRDCQSWTSENRSCPLSYQRLQNHTTLFKKGQPWHGCRSLRLCRQNGLNICVLYLCLTSVRLLLGYLLGLCSIYMALWNKTIGQFSRWILKICCRSGKKSLK